MSANIDTVHFEIAFVAVQVDGVNYIQSCLRFCADQTMVLVRWMASASGGIAVLI